MVYDKLLSKQSSISVIGLGYVGLPIALELAKMFNVIGFDINIDRIHMMKQGIDPSNELPPESFLNCSIAFTNDITELKKASFHIVAVPTPINKHNQPDLGPLINASNTLGEVIQKGDYIVFESTVYPGATEEDCVPIIEKKSGLQYKTDFKVGYSPERINPGDTLHTLTNITKIVSGCDSEALEQISLVYSKIVRAGIFKASSMKVAEAAKVIENTQRDLNIALMNELSIIFEKMELNTFEVLEAAGTKWNFLNFYPGLVGGHCVGVDPYYLTSKATELGHLPKVITAGRMVNDSMGEHIARLLVKKIIKLGKNPSNVKVLVMGITFKENVGDIRNSKAVNLIQELISYGIKVDIIDPFANKGSVKKDFGLTLSETPSKEYSAIVTAVAHKPYINLDEQSFLDRLIEPKILFDVKGIYRNKFNNLIYMSL